MANENSDKKVFEQIELAADFYQPAVYELLSFYQSLEFGNDPSDGQFVPMTTVQPYEQERTLMFAVGLIPPSSNVTRRILDRSATLQSLLGSVTVSAAEAEAHQVEDVRVDVADEGKGTVPASPRWQRRSAQRVGSLHASIQPMAQRLVEAAAREGINIVVTQGHRTNAEQDRLYAKGRTTPGQVVTGVKGGESWHNFGLAFDVGIVSAGPKPPAGEPSTAPSRDEWATIGALGKALGLEWGGDFSSLDDPGHFEYHPGLTKEQARAGQRPSVGTPALPIEDSAKPALGYQSDGSPNANKASKTIAQTANRDLNQTNLGKQFLAAQQATINLMSAALDQMAKTPPLRLLVNPQSFRTSAEKITSDGNWGRNGPIIEHWGEAQDKIEGSGKIAAFYALDAYNASGPGLTRTARQFSASYQNLLSLWLIYKNNGGIWFPDPIVPTGSHAKNLSVVGSVYLYYDHILYIGSFDTFSLTESETSPFTLEYSFAFTVRAWYLLDHLDDPQYTYGRPNKPTVPTTTSGPTALMGGNNAQPSPDVAPPPSLSAETAAAVDAALNANGT